MSAMAAIDKVLSNIWKFYAHNGPSMFVFIKARDAAKETCLDEATVEGVMEMYRQQGLLSRLEDMTQNEYRLLRRPSTRVPASVDGPYIEVLQAVLNKLNQEGEESVSRGKEYESSDLAQQLKCDGKLVYGALAELSRKRFLQETGKGPVHFKFKRQPPRNARSL